MKKLDLPTTLADDLEIITTICANAPWPPHQQIWQDAYTAYYNAAGNPWAISPVVLPKAIKDLQYDLYDSRGGGGPILRLRDTPKLKSCPVCGSPVTGHLDHYLPRAVFAEFAIMRANLVPACSHCNSGAKGKHFRGSNPERFIHPYFDQWADERLWLIRISPPYAAPTWHPTPLDKLEADQKAIVDFHLQHVLEKQFYRFADTTWSNLETELDLRLAGREPSVDNVRSVLELESRIAEATSGTNSWSAAFNRGLLENEDAISYLATKLGSAAAP